MLMITSIHTPFFCFRLEKYEKIHLCDLHGITEAMRSTPLSESLLRDIYMPLCHYHELLEAATTERIRNHRERWKIPNMYGHWAAKRRGTQRRIFPRQNVMLINVNNALIIRSRFN